MHVVDNKEAITTPDEAKAAYLITPRDKKAQQLALERWIDLCTTPSQVREAMEYLILESENWELALDKLDELRPKPKCA